MLKLRYAMYALAVILMATMNILTQEKEDLEVLTNNNCVEEPTDLIRVTVQQISKKEPAYVFTVTNLSEFHIFGLVVGEGNMFDGTKFSGSKWNTPIKMESPAGWNALLVDYQRSYYYWYIEDGSDKERMILPGKTVSDFRIYLPEDTRTFLGFDGDGITPSLPQVNFKDLPFHVSVSGAPKNCLWGVIKTVDYMD